MNELAKERQRKEVARAAFGLWIDRVWRARRQLFDPSTEQGRSKYWQDQLLKRLIEKGWIEKTEGDWRKRLYRVTEEGVAELKACVGSDRAMCEILWPGSFPDPEEDAGPPDDPDEPFDTEPEEEMFTQEQVLEALLKLMAATVEKLDRIERSSERALKILEQLL